MRRRIALYRRYLREGVDATLAAIYVRELKVAEAELRELANDRSDKRNE